MKLITISILAAVLLAACPSGPPTPPPVPPDPAPDPHPDPAATSCEQAADRYLQLRCGDVTREAFAEACERFEQLGGQATWRPSCMATAPNCTALDACRGN